MSDTVKTVINSIQTISVQVEGLTDMALTSDIEISGHQSPFDSFAMLLLCVELEQSLPPEQLNGRSVVEWFSTLNLSEDAPVTAADLADLLDKDLLSQT